MIKRKQKESPRKKIFKKHQIYLFIRKNKEHIPKKNTSAPPAKLLQARECITSFYFLTAGLIMSYT